MVDNLHQIGDSVYFLTRSGERLSGVITEIYSQDRVHILVDKKHGVVNPERHRVHISNLLPPSKLNRS